MDILNATDVVVLPIPQLPGGGRLEFLIEAPTLESVLEAGGLLLAGRDKSKDAEVEGPEPETVEWWLSQAQALETEMKRLLELGGKTTPRLVFDGPAGDGEVEWKRMHIVNRSQLVRAFVRVAGLGPGRADAAGTFPVEHGAGGPGGDGAGAAQPNGAATA